MRLCYLADARSPIARSWIEECARRGHEVHVISSYPCEGDAIPGAKIYQVPLALASLSRVRHDGGIGNAVERRSQESHLQRVLAELRTGRLAGIGRASRGWLAPLDLYPKINHVRTLINDIKPDLIHAMRLPFEGIMASLVDAPIPLVMSIWGNDLTLHADENAVVGWLTRKALRRTDALHCDCARDLRLAEQWGFDGNKPKVLLPGSGGIDCKVFYRGAKNSALLRELDIPDGAPVILNPRGFRQYVRNDVFFESIPLVLRFRPDALFLGLGMSGNPVAENWVSKLGIGKSVRLLGQFERQQMGDIYRLAEISISPSNHDGTPNTLLEAMSCGCLPVAGEIESVSEWIESGVNGMLCDPNDAQALADATLRGLNDEALRKSARRLNQELVATRADFAAVMDQALSFYGSLLNRGKQDESRLAARSR